MKHTISRTILLVVCTLLLIPLTTPTAHAKLEHEFNTMTAHDLVTGGELDVTEPILLEIGGEYEIRTYFDSMASDTTVTGAYFHTTSHPFFVFEANETQFYDGHFKISNNCPSLPTSIRLQAPSTAIRIEESYSLHCYGTDDFTHLTPGAVEGLNGAPVFAGVEEPQNPDLNGGQIAPKISGYAALHITVKPDFPKANDAAAATESNPDGAMLGDTADQTDTNQAIKQNSNITDNNLISRGVTEALPPRQDSHPDADDDSHTYHITITEVPAQTIPSQNTDISLIITISAITSCVTTTGLFFLLHKKSKHD